MSASERSIPRLARFSVLFLDLDRSLSDLGLPLQEFADQFNLPFIEASAKDGSNVERAFLTLVKDIFDKTDKATGETRATGGPLNIADNPTKGKKKKGCSI